MFIYNVETNNDFQASPKFTKIVLLGLTYVFLQIKFKECRI